ncbi:MAG: S8 family serine peptidase [Candidatus Marinimicrobia bacterium]|nr:S8 family serine peptidase [Candidatus Neomarinimicrobiota bacterium]
MNRVSCRCRGMRNILVVIWAFCGVGGVGAAPRPPVDWAALSAADAVPGELLVGYRPQAQTADLAVQMQGVHAAIGARVAHTYRSIPVQQVRIPEELTLEQAARHYQADPRVAYVEPNYIVRALDTTPDDPLFGDLWGMARIRAPRAWDVSQGSEDIVVAVIDTGIRPTHEDLADNIWVNPGEIPDNGIDDDGNGYVDDVWGWDFVNDDNDPTDDQGHGTHCAGTIGAVGNNALGVAGVNWTVKLVALKFLDSDGYGDTADAVRAVEYAAGLSAYIRLTSNSWGGGGYSQTLYNAIEQARLEGQLFIAAAGNSASNNDVLPHYPSSLTNENIIAVASIQSDGELSGFSCFGPESVDLAAPGSDILSCGNNNDSGYNRKSGTSMATPHVAGAVALLYSINPSLLWQDVRDAILLGAEPNPALEGRMVTEGELNLENSLQYVGAVLEFDRRAYRSDGVVTLLLKDRATALDELTVNVATYTDEALDPGSQRWTDAITVYRSTADGLFTNSFLLVTGVTAVHDDWLEGVYDYDMAGMPAQATALARIDDVPPRLTNVVAEAVQDTTARLTWLSDEPADTRGIVATNVPPGGLAGLPQSGVPELYTIMTETLMVDGVPETWYRHRLAVTNLAAYQIYYYAALSADYAGNETSYPAVLTSPLSEDYPFFITRGRTIAWFNDFEDGPGGLTTTNLNGVACWQHGQPLYGPEAAASGSNCWGTILNGNYPVLARATLTSPTVTVLEYPRLIFKSWWSFSGGRDFGRVEVNDGSGWVNMRTLRRESEGWETVEISLERFAGKSLRVRFAFESDERWVAAGWYVDDVEISHFRPHGLVLMNTLVQDDSDGDGYPEPGESFVLNLDLINTDDQHWNGVTGRVQCAHAGVTLANGPVPRLTYGDMAPGAVANSGNQLAVQVAPDVPAGTVLTFFHDTTAQGGGSWSESFNLLVANWERVTGVVTDQVSGVSVVGATVTGTAAGHPTVTATTGAGGAYTLHGLVQGVAYDVSAAQPGVFSRSEAQNVYGPSGGVDFGLAKAYAAPLPDALLLNLDQGRSVTESVWLRNTNAPYAQDLVYTGTVDVAWLSVEPVAGTVAAGSSNELSVTVTTTGLLPGAYTGTIALACNDVSGPLVEIPVNLTVDSGPVLDLVSVTVTGGDGDAFAEPGEAVDLTINLSNSGNASATAVVGGLALASPVPGVTVPVPVAGWPNISPFGQADSSSSPTLAIGGGVADGTVIPLQLTVTAAVDRVFFFETALTVAVRHAVSGQITVCAGGAPVPDAVISAVGSNGTFEAVSGPGGAYDLTGLPAGDYTVRAVPPAPYAAPAAEAVSLAGDQVVDFCVADWGLAVAPTAITATVAEGRTIVTNLVISNSGTTDGSVDFEILNVQGVYEPPPEPEAPVVIWSELRAGEDYLPGKLLVQFAPEVDAAHMSWAAQTVGARMVRRYQLINAAVFEVSPNLSLEGTADLLAAQPGVVRVEPNYLRQPFRTPDDPRFPDMWNLLNQRQTGGTLGADINVTGVWASTVGSVDIVIAVNDTGVMTNHPDLNGVCLPGYDFGSDDPDPYPDLIPLNETISHGTHVAGTIAALGNNAEGIAGVNWRARILPVKIAGVATNFVGEKVVTLPADAILAGTEYAAMNGAKVSNHSYGGYLFSGIEYAMIRAVWTNYGHLVVAAAGNEANDNDGVWKSYPASYDLPNIISVAAADHNDQLASFSNYGATSVDLAAPGVDIWSTIIQVDEGTNSTPGYAAWGGTSMAAPHVAGAAGLLWSLAPQASWDMIKDALLAGVRVDANLGDKVLSSGHLDVAGAAARVRALWLALDPPFAALVPAGGSVTNRLTLNVGATLLPGEYKADVRVRQGVNQVTVPVTLTVQAAPVPQVADVQVLGGDGDGVAEPNETVDLNIRLRNAGSALLLPSTGTLTSASADITILNGSAVWAGLESAEVGNSTNGFRIALGANPSDPALFNLTVRAANGGPWTNLTFALPTAPRYSVTGFVRDPRNEPVAGCPVEFWGARQGRTVTDANGAYRVDGATGGVVTVRALPTQHGRSDAFAADLSAGSVAADLLVRQTAPGFTNLVSVTLAEGSYQDVSLVLTNGGLDAFTYAATERPVRRVALIADADQLAGVAPMLTAAGLTVDYYYSNLVVYGASQYPVYSTDRSVVYTYDLVIADLSGKANGGRLLNAREADLIQEYLARGGRWLFTGASPLARPDDTRVRDLAGAAGMDGVTLGVGSAATPVNIWTNWDGTVIAPGTGLEVAAGWTDQASLDPDTETETLFRVGPYNKILRRAVGPGVVLYWNGNDRAGDWVNRGVWQDVLKTIVLQETADVVPWLTITPADQAIAAGATLNATLRVDAGLLPEGEHEAVIRLAGDYPGADDRAVKIEVNVIQPFFQAQSTTGVRDWLGRWLPGAGQPGASIFQVLWAGDDDQISPPTPDGRPTGDDVLLTTVVGRENFGRIGVGFEPTPDLGRFDLAFRVPAGLTPDYPHRRVYARAWDATSFDLAVAYGDSALQTLIVNEGEIRDFGTWTVGEPLRYPGINRDSNGDSIPDGWGVRIGLDPRAAILPLVPRATNLPGFAGPFSYPTAVVVAEKFVFVLNRGDGATVGHIQVWNRETRTLAHTFLNGFGQPTGMQKAPGANRLAVADTANHRIQVLNFDPDTGALTHAFNFGSPGSGPGQLNGPCDVAINALGRFIVADTQNSRIQTFDATGAHTATYGGLGTANGKFNKPQGVTVDVGGLIYVADTDNHRVQGLNGAGVWLWTQGSLASGAAPGQFFRPTGVQIGFAGRIFVGDAGNNRVQVFTAARDHVLTFGGLGALPGQLNKPQNTGPITTDGRLYVADTFNHRVQFFDTVIDADGDGMDDTWEIENGLDPTNPADAFFDNDGDLVLNIGEFRLRTNPNLADSDGDGWNDGREIATDYNPLDPEYDRLRLINMVPALNAMEITLPVEVGGQYLLQYRISLLPPADWLPLPDSAFTAPADGIHTLSIPLDVPPLLDLDHWFLRAIRTDE